MPRRAPVYEPPEPRPCDLPDDRIAAGGAMTIDEAADFLRLHPKTVAKLVRRKVLPSAKLGKRRVLYRAAVELYLAQQRVR